MAELLLTVAGLAGFGAYLNKDGKKSRGQENIRTHLSTRSMPNGRNIYNSQRVKQVHEGIFDEADELYKKGRFPHLTNVIPYRMESNNFQRSPKEIYHYRDDGEPNKDMFIAANSVTSTSTPTGEPINMGDSCEAKNDAAFISQNQAKYLDTELKDGTGDIVNNVEGYSSVEHGLIANYKKRNIAPYHIDMSKKYNSVKNNTNARYNYKDRNARDPNPSEYVSNNVNPISLPAFDRALHVKKPWALDRTVPLKCADGNKGAQRYAHNNMTPFYSGTQVNQPPLANDGDYEDNYRLEHYTGQTINSNEKKEVEGLFFKPQQQQIFSEPSLNIREEEHYVPSIYRNDERPFEQKYAPSTASIAGNKVYRLHERNVDELRTKSNPKVSYMQHDPNPGNAYVTNRGVQAEVRKNKPNRFYEQKRDQLIVTTGDTIKSRRYEDYGPLMKHTYRSHQNVLVQGDIAPTVGGRVGVRPHARVKLGERPQFGEYSSVEGAYPNKRTVNDENDIPVRTLRDMHMYQTGDTGIIGDREKQPQVYDPNDISAPTMRQLGMYQTGDTGMRGETELKHTAYDPNDIPNPTIKELDMYSTGETGIGSQEYFKTTSYDPNDVPNPTLKQLGMYRDYSGQHHEQFNPDGGYRNSNFVAYPTLKQITSNTSYTPSAGQVEGSKMKSYENMHNLHIKGLKGLTNVYRPPTDQGSKHIPIGESGTFVHEPSSRKFNWQNSTYAQKVYTPTKRLIPSQENKRYIPKSRFMGDLYDIPNPLTVKINQPTVNDSRGRRTN